MKYRPSRFLFSSVLAAGLLSSCKDDKAASDHLSSEVAKTVAENEILREEQRRDHETVLQLSIKVKELESQARSANLAQKETEARLSKLENDAAHAAASAPASPPAVNVEALAEKPATAPVAAAQPDTTKLSLPPDITSKVVVIEGDAGRGTGFLCTVDGSLWLYTAAHVISGNKTIVVRDQQNNRFQNFETMEIADGVDLARLKISGSNIKGLQLEDPSQSAEIGDLISAIGNSDGTGVVATENGEIRGKGPESWEVTTQIIPGNSGGPIIAQKTGKVLGIVTHLLVGKKETWAENTRFAEVRRFAARLDRSYQWTTVTPARFLKEYQIISSLDNDTQMGWAALTVLNEKAIISSINNSPYQRSEAQQAERTRKWVNEARRLINTNPQNSIAMTVNQIKSRGNRYSTVENLRTLSDTINGKLALGNDTLKPEAFSWYHRESYKQSVEWRERLLQQFKN